MASSPRSGLPALLAFALAAFLPLLSSGGAPFPQDLEPLSHVSRESKLRRCCVTMAMLVAEVALKAVQSVAAARRGAELRGAGVSAHVHRKQRAHVCSASATSGGGRDEDDSRDANKAAFYHRFRLRSSETVRRLVRWFLQTWLIPLILLLIDVALRRFRLTSASPGSSTWDPGGRLWTCLLRSRQNLGRGPGC